MQSKYRGLGRLGALAPVQDLLMQAAAKYNIPPSVLVAQADQESGFNPNAVSKAGAMGVMQLMPGTAKDLGVTEPFDPAQNIDAGARYLRQQYDRFGTWDLALAAYNAGGGNVHKYGGVPPFHETQDYVSSILVGRNSYLNLDQPQQPAPAPMPQTGDSGQVPTDVARIMNPDDPESGGGGGSEAGAMSGGMIALLAVAGIAIAMAFRK